MPANYVLLERIELNASAASVTFSNIPQSGYTDLKIVCSSRNTDTTGGNWGNYLIRFNGNSSGVYSDRAIYGTGSGAASLANSSATSSAGVYDVRDVATANTFSNSEIYIPNYLSNTNKSFSSDSVTETNATSAIAILSAGLFASTSTISSVSISPVVGSFVANSTFSLYGLAAVGTTPVIAPKATGGNLIESDGTYWIHTFYSTGTFTPLTGLTCDALVVAGGGAGGGGPSTNSDGGGGGGAGGYRTANGLSVLSGTSYTVTVGAGAAGAMTRGATGSNSNFVSITSSGGGGGATQGLPAGTSGGSGGGSTSSGGAGGAGNAGGYSPVEGYAGGASGGFTGAGGGGAGAVGANGSGSNVAGSAGGAGVASSISGTSVTYAGGGGGAGYNAGGGAGGAGGGGAGGNYQQAGNPGTAATGGGGGGANNHGSPRNGGNGGSGVVIIRYPIA